MSEVKEKKKGGVGKIIIIVAVIVAVLVLAYAMGWTEKLQDVKAMQAWFQGLGFVGYAIYVLLYVLIALFMLPGAAMTIVAGITFGSVLGALLALVGATIGASAAFIVAKYVARDAIVARFENNSVFKKIEDGVARDGVSFLILTRLVPIFPYNVQNYAYGVTSMKLPVFAAVSFVTMAPGAFVYAFMAGEIVASGFSVKLLIQFAAAGVILFLVSLIPKYIAKKKGINIKD